MGSEWLVRWQQVGPVFCILAFRAQSTKSSILKSIFYWTESQLKDPRKDGKVSNMRLEGRLLPQRLSALETGGLVPVRQNDVDGSNLARGR